MNVDISAPQSLKNPTNIAIQIPQIILIINLIVPLLIKLKNHHGQREKEALGGDASRDDRITIFTQNIYASADS